MSDTPLLVLAKKWRTEAAPHVGASGDEAAVAHGKTICAGELEAALGGSSDVLLVVLSAIEQELRDLDDDAERSTVTIASAREYHVGRASAFAQARKVIKRFDIAARKAGKR